MQLSCKCMRLLTCQPIFVKNVVDSGLILLNGEMHLGYKGLCFDGLGALRQSHWLFNK